ncbi:DUF3102 domain-containing protein [Lichenibacterium dinghuense]|uniref:DUF3102 domain-containing protein n=1 Tax=Lichenibacterium dinghuense TaxID=2895977 RepID=UPI001F16C87E|nr:DUF3102 domain-containing protein [Lichenibacterium sp. 6Y81]
MTTSNIATAINAAHDKVESHKREGTRYAMEAGRLLVEAKATVAHGGWDDWLKANVTFSPRTAQLYMRLVRITGDDPAKAQRVADLPLRKAARASRKTTAPTVVSLHRPEQERLVEAWKACRSDTRRAFAREIHERGDIDAKGYEKLIRTVEEGEAAQRVVKSIREHCGVEGIRTFDAALKAGCTPRQIALAIEAEMERKAAHAAATLDIAKDLTRRVSAVDG